MRVFVVIPAYNESKHIRAVLEKAQGYGQVVVVDDGSSDDTIKRIYDLKVHTLRHCINRGQGAALKTGIDYALACGAEVIVTIDSDGQHQPEEIPELIGPIKRGEVDIALGSRFLTTRMATDYKTDSRGSQTAIPWTKKWLILKPAIFFERIFTGLNLTDVHQGFRAMNRKAAQKIEITQDRMAHATEIILEIKRNNLRYKEVPVHVAYNEYGQGLKEGLRILKDLFFKKIIY